MTIHYMEQRSEEWLEIRKLKMTASKAQAIVANNKGLETYCLELVAEYLSSAEQEHYTNEHIERGILLEPDAISNYEFITNRNIEMVGFVTNSKYGKYTGCSPDGIDGIDGIVEVKCPSDINYMFLLINGIKAIKKEYIYQMQMQMMICDKSWCNFVAYNPNYDKNTLIYRINRDDEIFKKLTIGLKSGKEKIRNYLQKYKKLKN